MSQQKHFKYDRHTEHWDETLEDPERLKISESWFKENTLDYWRHAQMRKPLEIFIKSDADTSWLTVGDGRYGTDAHYLLKKGAKEVHASDISDSLLKIGHEKGFIDAYSAQNAESLSFEDNSFDYVYCKESFHHFPRPFIALDEMFRVARKAVILTEPRDILIDKPPFAFVMKTLKRLLRRPHNNGHSFEEVGNYVYSISERELEKFLLGMHYTDIAYIGCNDAYILGIEFIKMDSQDKLQKKIKHKMMRKIRIMDALCALKMSKTSLLTAALFKTPPNPETIDLLKQNEWKYKKLPKNPYL